MNQFSKFNKISKRITSFYTPTHNLNKGQNETTNKNAKCSVDGFKGFFVWKLDRLTSHFLKRKLKNKNFTIISNNCIGGGIYHKFGLKFTSPTVGLFFFPDEYLLFIENLEYYVKQKMSFIKTSRHQGNNEYRNKTCRFYPIGLIDDKIEVHFMHYKTEQEALKKWNRRCKRINFNNLFFTFTNDFDDKNGEYLQRYVNLSYEHKILFTSKHTSTEPEITVLMQDYKSNEFGDSARSRIYEKHLDLIKWLNGENNFLKENQQCR
ncbi:MAG: DUF1919 domain-containing protein [Candidatus Bathyarchaeia archaeon]|jgi:uncharacterized protein (DUF1919 family)